MNEQDIDRRLGALLCKPKPEPDSAFVDRVVLAARVDCQMRISRRQVLLRSVIDCGAAVAVGYSFYLMSQLGGAPADGMILPGGPAMAGLVMLLLWGAVALPVSRDRSGFSLAA